MNASVRVTYRHANLHLNYLILRYYVEWYAWVDTLIVGWINERSDEGVFMLWIVFHLDYLVIPH